MAEWGLHSDGSLDMLAKNMNTKALTKYERPKMKRDARQKERETAFLPGKSFHFRPFVFRYGFMNASYKLSTF